VGEREECELIRHQLAAGFDLLEEIVHILSIRERRGDRHDQNLELDGSFIRGEVSTG